MPGLSQQPGLLNWQDTLTMTTGSSQRCFKFQFWGPTLVSASRENVNHEDTHLELMLIIQKDLARVEILLWRCKVSLRCFRLANYGNDFENCLHVLASSRVEGKSLVEGPRVTPSCSTSTIVFHIGKSCIAPNGRFLPCK